MTISNSKERYVAQYSDRKSLFSVSVDLILTDQILPYDIFINSSGNDSRDRFVCIVEKGQKVSPHDLVRFKKKYFQLYILESERAIYAKTINRLNVDDSKKGEVLKDSAISYLGRLFDDDKEFTTEVLEETILDCRDSVESMVSLIQDYSIQDLQKLIAGLSFHDFYTYDHSINVSMYCISLYQMMHPGSNKDDIVQAGLGGMLHDLGKIKIPTYIINNPGKLSDKDFEKIKQHPGFGHDLLCRSQCDLGGVDLSGVKRAVHEHHENYNGTGYPRRLEGMEIHKLARITAIADFFDAITTKRSYHDVLPIDKALGVMENTVGKKIDPQYFAIFKNNAHEIVEKSNVTLPDAFDPCRPYNVLPFEERKKGKKKLNTRNEEDIGKVDYDGDIFGKGEKKKGA